MKRKLFLLLCTLLTMIGVQAQITDVTSTYLVNPSFETLKASDGTTDVTVKTKLSSGLYGWSIDNSNMSDYQVESVASGSSSGFVNGGSITPTEGTYYYFNRKGWANLSTTLSTTTKANVEPGTYYVVFDYKAADYSNNNKPQNNGTTIGITVKDATDATLATLPAVKRAYSIANNGSNPGTDSYMKDARWCKMGVAFTVETASAITISVQQNMVNSGRSDIVYDNFKLYKIGESQEIDFSGYIANPFFETGNKNAWTDNGGNVRRGGYEIWHVNNAKIYQTVTNLPNGKYSVSMQALHGEGESANSLLYAKVGETEKTAQATEPTSSSGGSAFATETGRISADANLGKISAEIEVTGGSLELGFKQTAGSQWDVFSNFTLTYIDPAVSALAFELPDDGAMVAGQWYKYVIANTAEYTVSATTAGDIKVTEDVLVSEYTGTAIEAGAHVNLTAGTYYYKSTSNNTLTITLNDPRVPARASLLDKINEVATARKESNEGTGVFQIPVSAGTTLASAKDVAQDVYDDENATLEEINTATSNLNTAIEAYEATTLNAPAAEKRYCIVLSNNGSWTYDGKAITYLANARNDMGNYNVQYLVAPNANYAQAIIFTQVEGNTYKMSQIDVEGNERYICTGKQYTGGNTSQIRTITDASKALVVKIEATGTANIFNIYNTEANQYIGSQDAGVFTVNSNKNFTISEASKATAKMQVSGVAKMGTFCAPFDVEIPDGVKAYTLSEGTNESWVHMNEVSGTKIAAGTPVLLTSDSKIDEAMEGYSVINAPDNSGLLQGAFVLTDVDKDAGNYLLQYQDGECAFYLVNSDGKKIGANRCYLHMEESGETPARIVIGGGDDPTAINAVEATAPEANTLKDGKYLIGNKIVLVKNGVKYGANGQKLN